jgi:uncharacterized protein
MTLTIQDKSESLRAILSDAGSVAIAFSGGTDSSFLVHFASGISGLRLLAVTVSTPYMFESEIKEAASFCKKYGIKHRVINMEMPGSIKGNPPERCYLCKKEVMQVVRRVAQEAEMTCIFDGTNADDVADYRPGMKALKELGIRSPLLEAGLTKEEIRVLAGKEGLAISNKQSNTCLLTRFPHDSVIMPDDLRRVENAEMIMTSMGFEGSRIRLHGETARIEIRKEHFLKIVHEETRISIVSSLKKLGFRYITVDLEGYRSGSMDKILEL